MTPSARFQELNRAMKRLRGEDFRVAIDGLDELDVTHDNVMFEACNTSFQVHVQVEPGEFARSYNVAQAITAPLLAVAENSPLLLDRRLWAESRIALFQESDERSDARQVRGHPARVGFGSGWVEDSALEIFREDVARFRVLLTRELDEDPAAVLERGGVPELSALRLHTGTVWRWNRACYGVLEGRPHLRIEHRTLPAGPTPIDEVANAALFFGLVTSPAEEFGDVRERLSFDDAKANFLRAAREGAKAQLVWLDGRRVAADDLVLSELLPLARESLAGSGVDPADVDRYLGVIAERVRREQTGARWMLRSLAAMEEEGTPELRSRAITRAMRDRQRSGRAVHTWELASLDDLRHEQPRYATVGQLMTTDVFSVRPADLAHLARSVMEWRDVRHLPVEDEQGRPAGLVTTRSLLRLYTASRGDDDPVPVSEIMEPDPPTVSPETPIGEAIARMQANALGCLLVVEDGRLAGIVTERDFLSVAAELLRGPATRA
jgi:CBS domain-containing protein